MTWKGLISEAHQPAPLFTPADAPSDFPRTEAVAVMVGDVDTATTAIGGCTCTAGGLGPRTEGLVAQPASVDTTTTMFNASRNWFKTGNTLRFWLGLEARIAIRADTTLHST